MSVCSCNGTALPKVPNATCPVDFGQIQKIVFQRMTSDGTTANKFTSDDPISALASWTAFNALEDGKKWVITPYVEAPTPDGGDAITFGGGNETVGGAVTTIGRNPVGMSFVLRKCEQGIIKALKGLQCELDLGVYLINGDNQVLAQKGATAGDYTPIPIRNLFVGDLMLNGLETPDSNALSFSFLPNWSDEVEVTTPDFKPLTQLTNKA